MRLMGEGTTFRRSLRVDVRDDALSPFGGLVLLREFEERTAFLGRFLAGLVDPRRAWRPFCPPPSTASCAACPA